MYLDFIARFLESLRNYEVMIVYRMQEKSEAREESGFEVICRFIEALVLLFQIGPCNDRHFTIAKLLDVSISRFPISSYRFKVNNRNTRTKCEIYSELTIKAPK